MRTHRTVRNLVSETSIDKSKLVMPYFVVEGRKVRKPIKSMPGLFHISADMLTKECEELMAVGVKSILLFGISTEKDNRAQSAYRADNILQKSVRAVRWHFSSEDLCIMSDTCLCGHTVDGHCGITKGAEIDNDETLELLAKIAVSQAASGVDFVAPSAMMDGQVGAIRKALNKENFQNVKIMSYAAKFASSFYGPFRDALGSTPQFGDRKTYQMDYRNPQEALREIEQDLLEGADIVMVKPALAYLDIIYRAQQAVNKPVAAYMVSAEYAMLKQYAATYEIPEQDIILETVTGIRRAGADIIITYFAKELAQWI